MRWRIWVVSVGLVACTKSNPAKLCTEGTCSDPAYPFCDVTGAIAGEAGACIAAACTADAFVECRGDVEVRCNVDGSNYNLQTCDRGCEDALGGCLLCTPGETACTNGSVATCDAAGTPTILESCPLGCFGSEPRCREIDPSNDFAMYLDMVPDPPSLVIENGSFYVDTGTVYDNGNEVTVPSFLVPAPTNGVAARVFVVDSLSITQATAVTAAAPATGPALVVLARGDIEITGKLSAPRTGTATGSVCNAGAGVGPQISDPITACAYSASASGGGGFATNGAKGGDLSSYAGGAGGIANGNEQLVPLRGGCSSGARFPVATSVRVNGFGGGAVQLVSRTRILVDGIVDVNGGIGGRAGVTCTLKSGEPGSCYSRGSGGAGGAILLEAPHVELGPNASLAAVGGAGSDATCGRFVCSPSGAGASPGVAAVPGTNLTQDCSSGDVNLPGGGGGGLGRIRINTADGTYVKSSSAIEGGDTSSGTIATR